jgi:hypothetical protein
VSDVIVNSPMGRVALDSADAVQLPDGTWVFKARNAQVESGEGNWSDVVFDQHGRILWNVSRDHWNGKGVFARGNDGYLYLIIAHTNEVQVGALKTPVWVGSEAPDPGPPPDNTGGDGDDDARIAALEQQVAALQHQLNGLTTQLDNLTGRVKALEARPTWTSDVDWQQARNCIFDYFGQHNATPELVGGRGRFEQYVLDIAWAKWGEGLIK